MNLTDLIAQYEPPTSDLYEVPSPWGPLTLRRFSPAVKLQMADMMMGLHGKIKLTTPAEGEEPQPADEDSRAKVAEAGVILVGASIVDDNDPSQLQFMTRSVFDPDGRAAGGELVFRSEKHRLFLVEHTVAIAVITFRVLDENRMMPRDLENVLSDAKKNEKKCSAASGPKHGVSSLGGSALLSALPPLVNSSSGSPSKSWSNGGRSGKRRRGEKKGRTRGKRR